MSIAVLVLLGLVQGLCEFLPISSSGHLVLLSNIFGVEDSLFVSIILHVATLFSLVVVMRKEIFYCLRHPFSEMSMKIVISTIFTCIVAIVLMPFITASFEGIMLPVAFLASAVLLFLSQKMSNGKKELDIKRAGIIGLAQGLAIFPGLSRSGTTLATGLMTGAKREECAKFSFLISLPIILGSLLLEIIKISTHAEMISVNWLGLVFAFFIAFVVGVITINFMIKLTTKLNFKYFTFYLILIAIVSAIVLWY